MRFEVGNLRVVYPNGLEALTSASLTVEHGEIVALIGPSGAGKSTLLRCINGLQPFTSGSVLLDGKDLARLSPAEIADLRRQVGFIWQEANVVERLSVMKNVLLGRLGYQRGASSLVHFFSRQDREIAVRSLERVNMLHRATQRGDRLSGGERQRVVIARALAQQPRLLLADEPVASLDVELARQVMNDLVRVAREEGVPTLISLHDISVARAVADRVVALVRGRTIFDGPPSALDDDVLARVYHTAPAPHVSDSRATGFTTTMSI